MSKKLTPKQQKVLDAMSETQWSTADSVDCSINTMVALKNKGLVKCRGTYKPGNYKYPSKTIQWKLVTGNTE